MTILIEDGLSLNIHRGVGQYTLTVENLVKELKLDYILPRKTLLGKIKNKILRRILYFLWLNTIFIIKLLFNKNIETVIFTSTLVPLIKIKRVKYITVIHDFLCELYPSSVKKSQRINSKLTIEIAKNYSDHIIVVSETVKQECVKLHNIQENKISVVYNCHTGKIINSTIDELSILSKYNLEPKKYILLVATIDNHKNGQMLIAAYNQISEKYPDIKLIVVGAKGNSNLSLDNKNIIMPGFVTDEDLSLLYKQSLIYAFPSFYEGFGIPIIDAQYLGIPVICSDIPVFREVAGEGALFCELNIESFAKGLDNLLKNENTRISFIEKGKENTVKFLIKNIKIQLENVLKLVSYKENKNENYNC